MSDTCNFKNRDTEILRSLVKFTFILISLAVPVSQVWAVTFNSGKHFSLPTAAASIASADLNKDNIPDLIIGRNPDIPSRGNIGVMLGNGNGTFQNERKFLVGYNSNQLEVSPYVTSIETADLNGDGNPDVIVAHNDSQDASAFSRLFVTVLFGLGNGNLQPAESYVFDADNQSSVKVTSIALTDMNGDGKTDVVVACTSLGGLGPIYFLKNLGGNSFQVVGPKIIGTRINKIAAASVNGDSFSDLVINTDNGLVILYGDGNFNYTSFDQRDETLQNLGLIVRDFNQDGKPDFVTTHRNYSGIRVFLSGAVGIPSVPVVYSINGLLPGSIRSDDFDADGNFDLLVGNQNDGSFTIFYGNSGGSFNRTESFFSNYPAAGIVAADFDSNGKKDFAVTFYRNPPQPQAAVFLNAPNPHRYYSDFDGDGKTDVAVFRPVDGVWYLNRSRLGFTAFQFGISSDKIVPADYDGDGKTDAAVYRGGIWYLLRSSSGFAAFQFGSPEDIPQPADYDGDGKAEPAVFRPADGTWYMLDLSNNRFSAIQFGAAADIPVVGDYDGDGKADQAVYRQGIWYLLRSSEGFTAVQFGIAGDKAAAADYDGDGRTDQSVYRQGIWYILNSRQGFTAAQFGIQTDLPVPADYDGDGKSDIAVYRDNTWYIQQTQNGFTAAQFGATGDKPVPYSYIQ